jgi:hypothetical protein
VPHTLVCIVGDGLRMVVDAATVRLGVATVEQGTSQRYDCGSSSTSLECNALPHVGQLNSTAWGSVNVVSRSTRSDV